MAAVITLAILFSPIKSTEPLETWEKGYVVTLTEPVSYKATKDEEKITLMKGWMLDAEVDGEKICAIYRGQRVIVPSDAVILARNKTR